MYANPLVWIKIKKIYSGDGPGLLDKQFHSFRYRLVRKKYVHIVPYYSVVGMLLSRSQDKVVLSSTKSIVSHYIMNWIVEGNHFKETELSYFSEELNQQVSLWIQEFSLEEKKELVTNFERITSKANIKSIEELKENHLKVLDILYESKDMSDAMKRALADFIKILVVCIEKTHKEEFKEFVTNLFKWDNHKDEIK